MPLAFFPREILLSLVAGDVTGGGGKPPYKKPTGTALLKCNKKVNNLIGCRPGMISAEILRYTKNRGSSVCMLEPQPS